MCIYIACTEHRTVIRFEIVRIFFLNTIETLNGPFARPSLSHFQFMYPRLIQVSNLAQSKVLTD